MPTFVAKPTVARSRRPAENYRRVCRPGELANRRTEHREDDEPAGLARAGTNAGVRRIYLSIARGITGANAKRDLPRRGGTSHSRSYGRMGALRHTGRRGIYCRMLAGIFASNRAPRRVRIHQLFLDDAVAGAIESIVEQNHVRGRSITDASKGRAHVRILPFRMTVRVQVFFVD